MEVEIPVNKVLDAREKRSFYRSKIANSGHANISFTLNIPGYPKSNEVVNSFFKVVLEDLKGFLIANRIFINNDELNIIDEAGNFFLTGLTIEQNNLHGIKNITEKFEERHELGRLIDVDIFDSNNLPISSGKHKKCVICSDKSALECMREENHTFDELRSVIFTNISDYCEKRRKTSIKKKLSQLATKSLLYEMSLTPKPGLVDFYDSGSHSDMDFQMFLNSTSALTPFWFEFADLGLNYKHSITNALSEVREIGLRAEAEMFASTNGVNTQKGLVFLLGLSVFTTAYVLKDHSTFSEKRFQDTLKKVTLNLIENELLNKSVSNTSHGIEVFNKYGLKGAGARYQAQYGFPIVFEDVLPYLFQYLNDETLSKKQETDLVLKNALLIIISKLDDTNVLYRKGIQTAEKLKSFASDVLNKNNTYDNLCKFCLNENVSPGGAADILAISLFIFSVAKEFDYTK